MITSPSLCVCIPATVLAAAASISAQCTTEWLSTGGLPDTNGDVAVSVEWDPDGAGPLLPLVVLAGNFTVAGDVVANHIVGYEPITRTWSKLGDGLDDRVHALAVLPSGNLVAAGEFTNAGGLPASRIAQWDGSTWQPLGMGLDNQASSLSVMPNGDLIVGGWFAVAGGAPAASIARWDGAAWSSLGTGIGSAFPSYQTTVSEMQVLGNGDLVVAGFFDLAGGVAAPNIARWNGVQWSAIPGLGSFGMSDITALTTLPSGELVAGGVLRLAGSTSPIGVAQWNGTSWSPIGAGAPTGITSLTTLPNGDLLACGTHHVVKFDGVTWTQVGAAPTGGYHVAQTLTPIATGELIVGGSFETASGQLRSYAQRFDGVGWGVLKSGLNNQVGAIAVHSNGGLVLGGSFVSNSGQASDYITHWDNGILSPLGAGTNGGVLALAIMPNSDVVAGGWFTTAGGVAARRLARWNGSQWSPFGTGCNKQVNALLVTEAGDLVVTGLFTTVDGVSANRIAKWDGVSWSALGSGLTGSFFLQAGMALCELPNGDLVVGGSFAFAGGIATDGLARWDGSAWSAMGLGATTVQALATMPNGDLVVGGLFQQIGGVPVGNVARYDGVTWSSIGGGANNSISTLLPLPDGGLIATGHFDTIGGVPAHRIARWGGSTWSPFGLGIGSVGGGAAASIAWQPNGDVVVGGSFVSVGAQGAAFLAQLSPTCPATVATIGAGCIGSGGANVLAAVAPPWLGATCTMVGSGMPSNGLVVGVRGLGLATLPLAAVLPQGAPGCSLLVTPDLLELHLPIAGLVTESFYAPNTVALLNQTLHEQFVSFEIGASGAITSLTSTNALSLTFGVF